MGLTSMCRFTYGICYVFWRWLVTIENDDVSTNWLWYSSLSLVYGSYEHIPFHIRNLLRFLTAAGFNRKWLIIIFIIELGLWVLRTCSVFIRAFFWRWLVTSDDDDVLTEYIVIFIIELGIWDVQAVKHVPFSAINNDDVSTDSIAMFIIDLGLQACANSILVFIWVLHGIALYFPVSYTGWLI